MALQVPERAELWQGWTPGLEHGGCAGLPGDLRRQGGSAAREGHVA